MKPKKPINLAAMTPSTQIFTTQMKRNKPVVKPAAKLAVAILAFISATPAMAGLVGYWKFDEFSGATSPDFSILNNPATLVSTVGTPTGRPGSGTAVSFSQNSNIYVSIPLAGGLQSIGGGTGDARSFTVSAWVNPTSQANYPEVWSFQSSAGNRALFYQGGNSTNSYAWSDTNGNFNMTTGVTVGNGAWHHLAVVFDGNSATNNYRYYYDGVLKAQKSIAAGQAVTLQASNGTLLLSKGHGGGNGQNWNGLIDDFVVLNNALTGGALNASASGDIALLMNGTYPALLRYWTGGGTPDGSGNLLWNDTNDWGGAGMAAGKILTFDTSNGLMTNLNNFTANTKFNGIVFRPTAGAFTLNGNAVNLTADVVNNSTNAQTIGLTGGLVLDGGDRTFNAASGNISVTNGIGEAQAGRGLIKSGANTLALSGTSNYSGATAVNAGKLLLNAGASLTNSAVTVSGSTSSLSGTGSVNQAVTVESSGHLAPGPDASTVGTLTIGNGLGLNAANLDVKIGASTDLVSVTGNLTLTGTTTVNFTPLAGFAYGDYTIISYTGSLLGAGSIVPPANNATYGFQVLTSTPNQIILRVYLTPSPKKWNGQVSGIDNSTWDIATTQTWLSGVTPTAYNESLLVGNDGAIFDDSAAGTTAVSLNTTVAPSTIAFSNNTKNYTISGSGSVAGTTALTASGSGTVTLSTANAFSGDTVVSGGTLALGHANALAGSTLNYDNQGGAVSFGSLSSANVGGLSGAQSLALVNNSSAAVALTIGGNDQNPTYSGTLSGAGSLVKSGNGTSTLSTDASYAGTTTVNSGVLAVTNLTGTSGVSVLGGTLNAQSYNASAALGISPGAAANISGTDLSLAGVTNDGTLNFTGGSGTITLASLSGAGTTTFSAGGSVATLSSGSIFFNGSSASVTTLGDAALTIQGNLTVDGGTQTTGSITGNGGLIKNTASTLTLNGTNTYSGANVLNAGIFSTNYVPAGILTFNGGTWQFTGLSGTKALGASGSSSYKLDVTNALTITRAANTYMTTIKTGAGALTLANNNADAGDLSVDEGTAILAGAGNQGTAVVNVGSVTDVKSGATLKLGKYNGVNFSDGNIYRSYTFHMSGGTFDVNGDTANTVPAIDGSGFITNNAASTTSVARMYTALSSKSFSGNMVDGAGKLGLNLAGSNALSWTLSGNNTYSGTTNIANGTLKAGSATAFSPNSTFTVNTNMTLDLAGFSNQIAGLTGGGTITSSVAGIANLTVNNDASNNNQDFTLTGKLQDGGAGKQVSLTKIGSKSLTLAGLNTYTGDTTVDGGTLTLADNAGLKFVVSDASSNRITGSATVIINGDFTIDTSAVTVATGTWNLVNAASLSETFGSTFTIASPGWTETANVWTRIDGANTWTFTEATGTLVLGNPPGSPFESWINGFTAIPVGDRDPGDDPDGDGATNIAEFAYNGVPNDSSNNGLFYFELADHGDPGTARELTFICAMRKSSTVNFAPDANNAQSSESAIDGINYTIEAVTDLLGTWNETVSYIGKSSTPPPGSVLPDLTGQDWEYRTFSAFDGLPGRGFIRGRISAAP